MQKIFIGIDGGGTKTGVSVLDDQGRIIFSASYGPSNLLNGTEFEGTLIVMFREIFLKLKELYRSKIILDIKSGFAGTSSNDYELRFRNVFSKAVLGFDIALGRLEIFSDALLALNVYFPTNPGILLISGTGSICYGKDIETNIFRTGGFGYLIDDAGSGFWFGKEAVKAALSSKFNYDKKSVLEEMVKEHYGIDKIEDLFATVYKSDSRSVISSASELVFRADEFGCEIAAEIIRRGADELVKLVNNCSKLIGESSPCVVIHGSVFKQEKLVMLIRKELEEKMNVYKSDKRIDLEAVVLMLEKSAQ